MRHYLQPFDRLRRIDCSLRWILPSLWAIVLSSMPAEAAQLEHWRFDSSQNRLEFSTDEGIQPRVQLIPNPTRLVVDLPGITLGQRTLKQNVGEQFRSVRLGQLNAQTARIVVELDPAYTLDPKQVKVDGASPKSWSINLPAPQRWQTGPQVTAAATATSLPAMAVTKPVSLLSSKPPTATSSSPEMAKNAAEINDILVTVDGIFLPTKNSKPQVSVKRSRNKKEITFTIKGIGIASQLAKTFKPDYHGIETMEFKAESDSEVELKLKVDKKSPDWFASISRFRGIVLLPKGGPSANPDARQPGTTLSLVNANRPKSPATRPQQVNAIRRIDLGGQQLLIEADQPLSYSTRWSGKNYQVTINSARLASGVKAPKLGFNSPLSDIDVKQSDDQTVTILAKPGANVRVTGVQRLANQSIAVNLFRPGQQRPTPTPSISSSPARPSISSSPTRPLSMSPISSKPVRGRKVIVIDPGHGGPDPGAIGIGGVRETDVVLDISLEVSRILQQQGAVVHLTRTREQDVDLPPRVSLAERVNATAFVSIHANAISMSRPDVNGLETYHAPGARLGSQLARTVHSTILRSMGMRNRKVRAARFYVIRKTSMPAILVETGFLTGAEDIVNLRNPAWRKRMAQAIAQGILNYMNGQSY